MTPCMDLELLKESRTALVVYDMQAGILSQLPHGGEVASRVGELLSACREAELPTFFLRHMSLPKKLMGRFQTRQAMAWQRLDNAEDIKPWFLRDSEAFQIAPDLKPSADEAVFDKIGFSAFKGTLLAMALRDLDCHSFLIAGIATEIGIEPSARHGADLGLTPIVVADCCGHGNGEQGERALDSLRHMGDAIVANLDEVKASL